MTILIIFINNNLHTKNTQNNTLTNLGRVRAVPRLSFHWHEEAPENVKKSLHSAHANGMNIALKRKGVALKRAFCREEEE